VYSIRNRSLFTVAATAAAAAAAQAKAVGSDFLWQQLQQLQPHMHVFGHSHFAWDMDLQGEAAVEAASEASYDAGSPVLYYR
jgi:Icc-related predicted phosphoesterase